MDNYGSYAGLGAGLIIMAVVLYVGTFALAIWVGYLIQRTAVKNGMLRAMQESGMTFAPRPGAPYPGGAQPGAGHPGAQPPYPGQAPQAGQPPRPTQPPVPPQTPPQAPPAPPTNP